MNEPCQGVIDLLEKTLAEAKSGHIQGLAIAVVDEFLGEPAGPREYSGRVVKVVARSHWYRADRHAMTIVASVQGLVTSLNDYAFKGGPRND